MEMQAIEVLQKALVDHADAFKSFTARIEEQTKGVSARLLEVEQRLEKRPSIALGAPGADDPNAIGDLIAKADGFEAFKKKDTKFLRVEVPRALLKTVTNATTFDGNQPLVGADRLQSIVHAPQRRLTIRDVLPQVITNSDVVQFATESSFTNNAGLQGGLTSPTVAGGEGEIKPQSDFAFTLTSNQVVTLAHWAAASRQVLQDSAMLSSYIQSRLLYGLKLVEEQQMLAGSGAASGQITGLVPSASAFSFGASGQNSLDVIALAISQLASRSYEPSAVVLNPVDWYSTKFALAKDTQGRYLLGAPAEVAQPRLWSLPVIPTASMTQGSFLVMDGQRAAVICDREAAAVQLSTEHADFFTRNLCALLCEERFALVIKDAGAMVTGSLSAF